MYVCMYVFSYYLFWRYHDFVVEDAAQIGAKRVLCCWIGELKKRVGNVSKELLLNVMPFVFI